MLGARHISLSQDTSKVTGRHWDPKRKLRARVAYAAHFCKFFFFSRHLTVTA